MLFGRYDKTLTAEKNEREFRELYRTLLLGGDEAKFSLIDDTLYEFFGKLNDELKKQNASQGEDAWGSGKTGRRTTDHGRQKKEVSEFGNK